MEGILRLPTTATATCLASLSSLSLSLSPSHPKLLFSLLTLPTTTPYIHPRTPEPPFERYTKQLTAVVRSFVPEQASYACHASPSPRFATWSGGLQGRAGAGGGRSSDSCKYPLLPSLDSFPPLHRSFGFLLTLPTHIHTHTHHDTRAHFVPRIFPGARATTPPLPLTLSLSLCPFIQRLCPKEGVGQRTAKREIHAATLLASQVHTGHLPACLSTCLPSSAGSPRWTCQSTLVAANGSLLSGRTSFFPPAGARNKVEPLVAPVLQLRTW